MTKVILKHANDEDETIDLAGSVRIEIDSAGGLISRSFHRDAVIGVEYAPEYVPAKAKAKAASKAAKK